MVRLIGPTFDAANDASSNPLPRIERKLKITQLDSVLIEEPQAGFLAGVVTKFIRLNDLRWASYPAPDRANRVLNDLVVNGQVHDTPDALKRFLAGSSPSVTNQCLSMPAL
ncbi:MAG: hypothetical protein DI537_20475 [Stutzerimonas stutzeri]|nr:MAG: hypothetical protein DI537_20475 [Stutzerimonas stutzeri]